DELGLADVEYRLTGGAGEGGGWAGDVRVMQLALDRIKPKGWRPRKTSEAAIRAAAKDVWASVGKPKPRACDNVFIARSGTSRRRGCGVAWSILRGLGPCDRSSHLPRPTQSPRVGG